MKDNVDDTQKKYKALANECRLRLMRLLLFADTELCICEIMDALEKEQYQISRCLGVLKRAELVKEDKDGRLQFYSPKKKGAVNKALFKSIKNVEDDGRFKEDMKRLENRLAKRENGKVTVTYCGV